MAVWASQNIMFESAITSRCMHEGPQLSCSSLMWCEAASLKHFAVATKICFIRCTCKNSLYESSLRNLRSQWIKLPYWRSLNQWYWFKKPSSFIVFISYMISEVLNILSAKVQLRFRWCEFHWKRMLVHTNANMLHVIANNMSHCWLYVLLNSLPRNES